jgi:hypothetical protein
MLDYYADNRGFGRFGFRTEERSLAMKQRDTVYKALCGVGIAALVVPLLVYAATFTQGVAYDPDGGSGPPMTWVWFKWQWNVTNTHSYNITGYADPDDADLMREVWWIIPDQSVAHDNPGLYQGPVLGPGDFWIHERNPYWVDVMRSGNNYYWKWDAWDVSGNCQHSATYNGGQGGKYICY